MISVDIRFLRLLKVLRFLERDDNANVHWHIRGSSEPLEPSEPYHQGIIPIDSK